MPYLRGRTFLDYRVYILIMCKYDKRNNNRIPMRAEAAVWVSAITIFSGTTFCHQAK